MNKIPNLVSLLSNLPSELLSDQTIFNSVLKDNDIWSLVSPNKQQELLNKHLPTSLSTQEKEESVKMLLDNQLKRFDDDPLDNVFAHLYVAKVSPEMSKTMDEIARLKRKAYFIQEQERQCKLLNQVLTHRRILFQLAADSSPHGISRLHCADPKNPFYKDNARSLFEHRKALRREHRVNARLRAELKNLFPDSQTISSDEEDDLKPDTRDLSCLWLHCFPDSMSVDTDIDSNGLQADYINMLRKHRRKRKVLSENASNDPVMDISNITLDDIISRVANESDEDSVFSSLASHSETPLISSGGKVVASSGNKNSNSKQSIGSNFHSSRKKSKSTTSIDKNKATPPPPPPNIYSASLPAAIQPPNISISSSICFPTSLPHSSSSLPSTSAPSLSPIVRGNESDNDPNSCLMSSFAVDAKMSVDPITNSHIKQEPKDIFDFDSESPPQSLPLPPLSFGTPNSQPSTVTSFTSLITSPSSQSFSVSTPNFQLASSSSSSLTPVTSVFTPNVSNNIFSSSVPPKPAIIDSEMMAQIPISYKKPPTSFFALLRDIFYINAPNDYRLTLHKVEELAKDRLRDFDPQLGWSYEMVQGAMNYLSGVLPPPEMIPLVDYKEKNQQWQWIGVSRDSDEVLLSLNQEWLEELDKNRSFSLLESSSAASLTVNITSWTVRKATDEEKKIYQEQEAYRYQNPHKAFTFHVHGYTSVVGPVKGCGIGASTATHSASPNKAREHSLLVSDRPPFVTLLSLVRDAAARLPNGEGTRADICELLRDSQYILPNVSDQQVNTIVSGALDRLHYEKDPCVKYDVNRKVWIYLHRHRSEEEFERLHEVQIAAAKAKRSLSKTQRKFSSTPKQPSITTNSVISLPATTITSCLINDVPCINSKEFNQLNVVSTAITTSIPSLSTIAVTSSPKIVSPPPQSISIPAPPPPPLPPPPTPPQPQQKPPTPILSAQIPISISQTPIIPITSTAVTSSAVFAESCKPGSTPTILLPITTILSSTLSLPSSSPHFANAVTLQPKSPVFSIASLPAPFKNADSTVSLANLTLPSSTSVNSSSSFPATLPPGTPVVSCNITDPDGNNAKKKVLRAKLIIFKVQPSDQSSKK